MRFMEKKHLKELIKESRMKFFLAVCLLLNISTGCGNNSKDARKSELRNAVPVEVPMKANNPRLAVTAVA